MALRLGSNINLDKVVKNLGQRYKLVPFLDLEIGRGEFEWHFDFEPKKGDDAWHPSGDCVPSVHDLWLKTQDHEPRVIPTSLMKAFMVGHFWHQYLQWIVHMRLEFCEEKAIERRGKKIWDYTCDCDRDEKTPLNCWCCTGQEPLPYHWATGSGDIAPCIIPDIGRYAVDFKTMNARTFAMGPDLGLMAKWECQGNIYLDFFDMDEILFVGICKDSPHDMKEWMFRRNQPLIDAIYNKWKLVSACLDEGIEPPEDEDIELPLEGAYTGK